jgi:hypothetical protein
MRLTLRTSALLAMLALVMPPTARADGFHCGNRIVTEGMYQYDVRQICGEPADVVRTSILRRPVVWRFGRPWYAGPEEVPVTVETWIYDFGPMRLMRKLRFEDGVLTNVETLGHGHHR